MNFLSSCIPSFPSFPKHNFRLAVSFCSTSLLLSSCQHPLNVRKCSCTNYTLTQKTRGIYQYRTQTHILYSNRSYYQRQCLTRANKSFLSSYTLRAAVVRSWHFLFAILSGSVSRSVMSTAREYSATCVRFNQQVVSIFRVGQSLYFVCVCVQVCVL